MKKIINSQQELNLTPIDFIGEIIIIGGTITNPINLKVFYEKAKVILNNNAVIIMCENLQVKEMYGNSQVNYMMGNSQVNRMCENSQVNHMCENSQVKEMCENSQVKQMCENSQVNYMMGNSQVNRMCENSQVKEMYGNSQVKEMWGNSQVKEMYGNSQVKEMWGNSQVKEMYGNSQVKEMWGNSQVKINNINNKINTYGYNYIFVNKSINDLSNINVNKTSQILFFDTFKTNQSVDFYLKNYDIKKKDKNTLIMFKAVHKSKDGIYYSDYDISFTWEIGQSYNHECSRDVEYSCTNGLHVSDLHFAKLFGKSWNDLAILEVEVPIKKIVISKDCDGKIRTSELKVIRELDKTEY